MPVLPSLRLYTAAAGESVLREGQESDGHLYYLVEGKAKLFCSLSNGNTFLLDFLQGGCFIGELELLRVRSGTMGVKTMTPCTLLALPIGEMREQLLSDPVFLRTLCVSLAQKEERRMMALSRTHGFRLPVRLARFILDASVDGEYRERGTDVSAHLGVSYRHLSEVMRSFIEAGCLQKIPGGYAVTDRAYLRCLASQSDME